MIKLFAKYSNVTPKTSKNTKKKLTLPVQTLFKFLFLFFYTYFLNKLLNNSYFIFYTVQYKLQC